MSVLMLINSPSPYRNPVLNELAAKGLDFRAVYVDEGGEAHGWGEPELRHPHVIAASPREAANLACSAIESGKADLLVAFGYRSKPYRAALHAAKVKRLPVVMVSDTNMDDVRTQPLWRRWTRRLIMRALIPRHAIAWTIGSKNAEFWSLDGGIPQQHLIPYEVPVLPGGAEPQNRSRRQSDPLRLLFVGRLVPVKRVGDVVAAVKLLPANLRWRLTIVGHGPESESLRAAAVGESRIRLVGAVEYQNLDRHYRDADVLVVPSEREPWGMVVNEALGFGVRVIATTAVGATHDLLNGANGATYPPGDLPALAAELVRSAEITFQPGRVPATDTASLMLSSLETIRGHAGERVGR